jgi:hypothetical protein
MRALQAFFIEASSDRAGGQTIDVVSPATEHVKGSRHAARGPMSVQQYAHATRSITRTCRVGMRPCGRALRDTTLGSYWNCRRED